MTDVLSDVRAELLREGVEEDRITNALARVRARWGGSQTYVRATDRTARDERLRTAINDGRPIDEAAKLAGCSPATVRRRRSEWL